MAKSFLETIASPETLIILPIAVIIDIIGIILVVFGLDDFWITDAIALFFFGSWGAIRPQPASASEEAEIQMPPIRQEDRKKALGQIKEEAKKISEEAKKAQKATKTAKWAKRLKWLELIPYIGAFPLWTISVYLTIKNS